MKKMPALRMKKPPALRNKKTPDLPGNAEIRTLRTGRPAAAGIPAGAESGESARFSLQNEEEVRAFALKTAKTLQPGAVLALTGDLGTGKTTFTRYLALGLGIDEPVTSPTFNLIREYRSGRLPLFHFDVYRMEDPEDLLRTGWEEYAEGDGVTVVEWADRFPQLMPPRTIWISIEYGTAQGRREYRISGGEPVQDNSRRPVPQGFSGEGLRTREAAGGTRRESLSGRPETSDREEPDRESSTGREADRGAAGRGKAEREHSRPESGKPAGGGKPRPRSLRESRESVRILAIDTTGAAASAALLETGGGLPSGIWQKKSRIPSAHLQNLLPMVDALLKDRELSIDDVTHIAVSEGPGSFTGIRIGVATARALAQAKNRPVIGVPTLFSFLFSGSADLVRGHLLCPIFDARRGQVYGGVYFWKLSGNAEEAEETEQAAAALPAEAAAGEALPLAEFLDRVEGLLPGLPPEIEEGILFFGDGIDAGRETLEEWAGRIRKGGIPVSLAAEEIRFQQAAAAARAAEWLLAGKPWIGEGPRLLSYNEAMPRYLRKPEAQRKLEAGQLSPKAAGDPSEKNNGGTGENGEQAKNRAAGKNRKDGKKGKNGKAAGKS